MAKSTDRLKAIFETQVEMLHTRSEMGELDSEDVKKLEALVRAWKIFNSTDVKKANLNDKFEEMTVDQLLALARSEN